MAGYSTGLAPELYLLIGSGMGDVGLRVVEITAEAAATGHSLRPRQAG